MGPAGDSTYWAVLRAVIERNLEDSAAAIDEAARIMADAVADGGRVLVYDTGHMLERELIHRAGGLIAFAPLAFSLDVRQNLIHQPTAEVGDPPDEALFGFVHYALQEADLRPPDALLLASVTGTRKVPVEVAVQARSRGVPVVGMTSRAFSQAALVRHPGGRRLADVADVVIWNDCAVGDAAIDVPGLEAPLAPTSGVSAAVLAWTLVERIARRLALANNPPAVIESMNLAGASERNRERARRQVAARPSRGTAAKGDCRDPG